MQTYSHIHEQASLGCSEDQMSLESTTAIYVHTLSLPLRESALREGAHVFLIFTSYHNELKVLHKGQTLNFTNSASLGAVDGSGWLEREKEAGVRLWRTLHTPMLSLWPNSELVYQICLCARGRTELWKEPGVSCPTVMSCDVWTPGHLAALSV